MYTVFSSGSCRLLKSINDGYGIISPIHSMFHNFFGINFFGKLHSTKQHIQFIKWLNDDIQIPNEILPLFLTSYNTNKELNGGNSFGVEKMDAIETLQNKKEIIKKNFNTCEVFIFEICSIKIFVKDNYYIQFENSTSYDTEYIQSIDELLDDLEILYNLLPKNSKVIFQTHFRPNIIYNDENKAILAREMIYNTITKFCNKHSNTIIYDPSFLLNKNSTLFDGDTHYTESGYNASFKYLYHLISGASL